MSMKCPHCGMLLDISLIVSNVSRPEVEWIIRHPGKGHYITCASFDEAMDEWFEGFNVPIKVVNGVLELFGDSHKRVKDYFESRSRT